MSRAVCVISLFACLTLNACALNERLLELSGRASVVESSLHVQHGQFALDAADDHARRRAQQVGRPWIVGKAQPLAREVTLPPALRADVKTTLLFADGPLELPEIADRITAVTRIPVRVHPEALLPHDAFMPRLSTAAGAGVPAVRSAPKRVYLSGTAEPLARILDRISAGLGVVWSYRDERIEFYRTQTRVFSIKALTLDAEAEASLGQNKGSTTDGGFSSLSRTRLRSNDDSLFDVIRARIEPFLTRSGVVVAQPGASGTIVVTDTPDVLDQIAAYIHLENKVLTRRIRLVFEEITLATRDSAQAGMDWNLIFSSARIAAMASMGGSTAVEAGIASLGLVQGPFSGSEAIVAALSEAGTVVRRSSVPVLTLNRRPVTHAVRTTFSYIDRVDTTALSDGLGIALPSVSVSQKEETVGSLLTLLPDAQDDGRILLSIAYDNTIAQPVKTIRFGDRDNPLQLQQVTIDGNGTVQQVVLQPGQPMLISGFDRSHEEADSRRLNPGLPMLFGGSDRTASEQLITVIIVTAQVEEGI